MTSQRSQTKKIPGASGKSNPVIPDNPIAQAISTMLFVGPDEGCDCNFCQMGRQAKAELTKFMMQGGGSWPRSQSPGTE